MPEARVRRRRRRWHLVLAVLVVALVAWAAWLVMFSQLFGVRQIDVQGVSLVSSDDVIAAAGVSTGLPMVRVSQQTVSGLVTAALPAVASVDVQRKWPSTLVLRVTERVAVYQVASGGQYGMVSADGVVFYQGPMDQTLLVAQVAVDNQALLAGVATVVASLPAELAAHVQLVQAPTGDSITLQLDDDRQVFWGSAEQSDLKAQVIMPLLTVPGKVYDVSAPSAPAVR